jgi:hypothetical protein
VLSLMQLLFGQHMGPTHRWFNGQSVWEVHSLTEGHAPLMPQKPLPPTLSKHWQGPQEGSLVHGWLHTVHGSVHGGPRHVPCSQAAPPVHCSHNVKIKALRNEVEGGSRTTMPQPPQLLGSVMRSGHSLPHEG